MDSILLPLVTFLPCMGIPLLWMTNSVKAQRWIGTGTCGLMAALCFYIYAGFDSSQASTLLGASSQYAFSTPWINLAGFQINFAMESQLDELGKALTAEQLAQAEPIIKKWKGKVRK